jgi:hypothetical protein
VNSGAISFDLLDAAAMVPILSLERKKIGGEVADEG